MLTKILISEHYFSMVQKYYMPYPPLPNLLQRVEWLIRQVSLYTGRPTKAQQEYIDLFERLTKIALNELYDIIYGPLMNLNLRLEKEGIKKIKTRIN